MSKETQVKILLKKEYLIVDKFSISKRRMFLLFKVKLCYYIFFSLLFYMNKRVDINMQAPQQVVLNRAYASR